MAPMETCYYEAAARHLADAQLLLEEGRWDNAVYHAGYVVECAFKTLVAVYVGGADARKFNHDLQQLQGPALDRLRVLYPALALRLPAGSTAGTVLADHHPERRYATSSLWSESDAHTAIQRAADIYAEIVPPLLLDGRL